MAATMVVLVATGFLTHYIPLQ